MPFGPSHKIILNIAKSALHSFFREIRVINEDNVPTDGPLIVLCTHHNMVVDPAILSSTIPHGRLVHYWAKASLFGNPIAKKILLDSGNIPVNRKSKDNQAMFKGTFDVLALGEIVGLFPEGTSYTEPRIMQVKDGAAWAALEYTKWASSEEGRARQAKELKIIPAGLVYTNKSKYRSCAIMEFGKPITLTSLADQFASTDPAVAKQAVKKLTKQIEDSMMTLTINAPDWETLYAGKMARELLWEDETKINLDEFVAVSQTLMDLFTYNNPCKSYPGVKEALLKYSSLLSASKLTNAAIAQLPLPRALDPSRPTPLPSRLSTLAFLIFSSIGCILPLPFVAVPLLINAPTYAMARYGAHLVIGEEETQAQMKIVFGLLLTLVSYGVLFTLIWAFFWLTPVGAVLAATVVYMLYNYYLRTIDNFYARAKRLIAAWRVLVGVWGPREWDMSSSALSQWTTPEIPPPNQWIDKPLTPVPGASGSTTPAVNATTPAPATNIAAKVANKLKKKPASRVLIRHVLRARIEASRALANFLDELERVSPRVRVSPHLGHPEGSFEEGYVSGVSSDMSDYLDARVPASGTSGASTPSTPQPEKRAYLEGREIINFLRARGAKIAHARTESDWAALSTDDEGRSSPALVSPGADEVDEVVWVSPAKN